MDEEYVCVANADAQDDTPMEFPLENDGTLTLSTIQSHFPNAIGLKYKAPSGAWRGLRAVDNVFDPPKSGWSDITYYITESESLKRKISESSTQPLKVSKGIVPVVNPLLQDIGVFGLPWTTTDEELKEYFSEHCGDVKYAEVKKDRETGKSRGFGFIRFSSEESAQAAVGREHFIGGRRVEVKLKEEKPMKLFVGRLPSGTTREDLLDYFGKFGEVTDTYVPQPFKGFGFVTYASSEVGGHVLYQDHMMNGLKLNLGKGEESKSYNTKRQERRGGDSNGSFNDRSKSPYNDRNRGHGSSNRSNRDRDNDLKDRDKDLKDRDNDFKATLLAYLQSQP